MATTPLPGNYQSFLQVDSNKEELLNFLVDHIGKETPPDTRIMIHVADCVAQGYRKVTIRTVDTDVAVLAVSVVIPLDISELSPMVQVRHSGT